jgi:drug/metabolite transporter (DMT)-like permease
LFYFTVIIMLISGVISIFNWTPINTLDKIRLFFMAGATTFSHYSYVQALRLGKVTLVAPFEYSRLVFAIPVGVFFFGEQIYLSTIFAAIIIIASNLYVMYRARVR